MNDFSMVLSQQDSVPFIDLAGTAEPRRRRTELSPKIKKEICLYKARNPSMTQRDVCHFAEKSLGVRIGRSTVCDILKERDRWMLLGDVAISTRMRRPKYEELEQALSAWCEMTRSQPDAPSITDDMLREQTKTLCEQLGIKDFHFTSSWLSRYKLRRMLMTETIREEDSSSKFEEMPESGDPSSYPALDQEVEDVLQHQPSTSHFRANHYYYCEALELNYRMDWHKGPPDRLSLLLTFDLSTKERLTPLVVWRLARARCFGPLFNPNQLCTWRHSPAASLTPDLIAEWLETLDSQCRLREHRALLLANLPAHLIPENARTENISLYPSSYWLRPGETKDFEGIAGHFRALFGIQQLSQLVEAAEESAEPPTMDVKQALYCIRDAWTAVSPSLVIRRLLTFTDLHLPFVEEGDCTDFVEQKLNEALGHPSGTGENSKVETGALAQPATVEMDDSEAPAEVTPEAAREAAERLMLFAEQHLGEGPGAFAVTDLDLLRATRRRCVVQIRERKRQAQNAAEALPPVKVERCDSTFAMH